VALPGVNCVKVGVHPGVKKFPLIIERGLLPADALAHVRPHNMLPIAIVGLLRVRFAGILRISLNSICRSVAGRSLRLLGGGTTAGNEKNKSENDVGALHGVSFCERRVAL